MKSLLIVLTLALLFFDVLSAQTVIIRLWPDGVPGAKTDPNYSEQTLMDGGGSPRVSRVTDPTLMIYPAPAEKANGTAVIICPGGGYTLLAIDHEGYQIAEWLNDLGITAVILKYRLPADAIMENKSVGPLQDVQEAVRTVRRRAGEWKVDPGRVGIIGFSAGGHLAATASTLYAEPVHNAIDTTSARPDFTILLYPVISMQQANTHGGSRRNLLGDNAPQALLDKFSNELQVNPQTPPAFLVHSSDDAAVPVSNSIAYFQALTNHRVPAELHVYQKGGHGYGLARDRGTEAGWPDACVKWLKALGLL